ncbi:MAG TPA: GGDEF domain-containing protein [Longimicrobiales bacterium]|nr:GGDEF domain-containing protein [Longimicrobiales bacterium]
MDAAQKKRIKVRGVALASGGLVVALVLILGGRGLGLTEISPREWGTAALLTGIIQAVLLVIALRGWDRHLAWDPHFLYVPLIGAMLLLGLYMLLAPELRFAILPGWFVALLFTAGLAGFHAVVVLSSAMTLGYFGVAVLLYRQGYPLSLTFEASVAGSVFVISMYAGLVFERLRSDRREMLDLRRRLADMALTDSLTGLPNRRHFEEVLRAELDRVQRYGGVCAVAMVDVDFFKHYNDSVGHLAGDIALRELADVMRRELRLHDMVARYGGEEFALIMINASRDEALPIIERLRLDVQEHPFRHRDIQPAGRLTVSAGLAGFPEDGTTYEQLLKRADDALYRAKDAGRNRVALAQRDIAEQPA